MYVGLDKYEARSVNIVMSLKNLVGFQSLLNSIKAVVDPLNKQDL
jgi:hypothetical protein